MERKDILKILGDEIESDKISELLNLFHDENNKTKSLIDSEKERANEFEKELKSANDRIKELEKNAGSITEKDKEIAGYLNEIADLKAQNQLVQIDSYETVKLMEAGAFDIDLCKKALDYDRKEIKSKDDYSIIDDAINSQIENRKFLFKSNEPTKSDDSEKDSESETKKKKTGYQPRSGSKDGKSGQSLGSKMAKELMSGTNGFGVK